MRAMVLHRPGEGLNTEERPVPEPGPGQVLIRVHACGVCRTDLHVVDGDLPPVRDAIVPGHETVGMIAALGGGIAPPPAPDQGSDAVFPGPTRRPAQV